MSYSYQEHLRTKEQVMQERDANNLPVVTYTRGEDLSGTLQGAGGIGGLLARTDMGRLTVNDPLASAYYHADGNGNITALVTDLMDTNQVLVAKYLYDSYGNLLAASGPLAGGNKNRFSSKEWDSQAGLYYYGFRFYDPNLQRWPNQDPLSNPGFIINLIHHSLGQTAQLVFTAVGDDSYTGVYDFVNDNPINNHDYLGLDNCKPPCTSAPPLSNTSPACDSYGNGMYLGSSLSCFCKCAGNSPWAQQVRGCLACEFQQGTDIATAHHTCYAAAGGILNGPVSTLAYCWLECWGPPNAPAPVYPNPL